MPALCRGRGAHDLAGRGRSGRATTSAGSWRSSYAEQRTETGPRATSRRDRRASSTCWSTSRWCGPSTSRTRVVPSARSHSQSVAPRPPAPVDVSTLAVGERQPVSSAQPPNVRPRPPSVRHRRCRARAPRSTAARRSGCRSASQLAHPVARWSGAAGRGSHNAVRRACGRSLVAREQQDGRLDPAPRDARPRIEPSPRSGRRERKKSTRVTGSKLSSSSTSTLTCGRLHPSSPCSSLLSGSRACCAVRRAAQRANRAGCG